MNAEKFGSQPFSAVSERGNFNEVINVALINIPKIRNCIKCGKIFAAMHGEKVCKDCVQKEKEFEEQVITYIRENPGKSVKEVMEATGASDKLMKRMMQDGIFSNASVNRVEGATYPCMSCGRPITSGTYCMDCLSRLRDQTKKAAERMQIRIKEDPNMSTIERLDKMAEREFERENRINGMRRGNFSKGMFKDR
ncbi:MAG: hypothetical protein IJT73_01505 [Selenomonadaceae bacterium]|nr:hypothetical protein [Selenomonadaceae bacterium]